MFPHITDDEYTEVGEKIAALYEEFPNPEPEVTTRVNVLGWMRWSRDYLTFRAQGYSHERAVVATQNAIRRVVGLPEEVPPVTGDRIVGQLRIEGGAFVDEGEA